MKRALSAILTYFMIMAPALATALGPFPAYATGPGSVTFPNNLSYGVVFDSGGAYHSTTVICDFAAAANCAGVNASNALIVNDGLGQSQGATSSGVIGPMVQGVVSFTAPTYGNATLGALSLDTGGNLRISCVVGCSSGGGGGSGGQADESAFTQGLSFAQPIGGIFTTSPTNLTTGQFGSVRLSADRALFVDLTDVGGAAIALGQTTMSASIPVAIASNQGTITVGQGTGANLHVDCDSGCSSSPAPADESAFTAGTTSQSPIGAFFQTTATSNPLTTGQMGALQATANRALFINLRNASGTEIGTSGAPVRVDPTGTTTQPVSLSGNQAINEVQFGGNAVVTGGINGSQGVGGLAASGASVSGNPLLQGCRAQNAEPTAVTNGQAVDNACDLLGKQITIPYSNKENFLAGQNNTTGTSATTLIAAQGAGVKIYVTAIQCYNTGATTSTITLNNTQADTHNWIGGNMSGSGFNTTFPTPLVVAANTALTFTPGSASTTQYCDVQAFSGS